MNKFKIGKTIGNTDFYIDFNKISSAGYCILGRCGTGKSTQIQSLVSEAYKNDDIEIAVISEFKDEYLTKYGENFYIDDYSFNPFVVSKKAQETFDASSLLNGFYFDRIADYCELLCDGRFFDKNIIRSAVSYFVSSISLDNLSKSTPYDFIDVLLNSKYKEFVGLGEFLSTEFKNKYFPILNNQKGKIIVYSIEKAYYKNSELAIFNALCKIEEHIAETKGSGKKFCLFIDYSTTNEIIINKILQLTRQIRFLGGCLVWTCYNIKECDVIRAFLCNCGVVQLFSLNYYEMEAVSNMLHENFDNLRDLIANESVIYIDGKKIYCRNDFNRDKINY